MTERRADACLFVVVYAVGAVVWALAAYGAWSLAR